MQTAEANADFGKFAITICAILPTPSIMQDHISLCGCDQQYNSSIIGCIEKTYQYRIYES